MSPTVLLIVYCLLILVGSLAGGWIPHMIRLTHTRMQLAISFIGGAMLGVGLLHLLPHAYFEFHDIYPPVWWLMAGFLAMFFVERVFHFHHHDVPAEQPPLTAAVAEGRSEIHAGEHDHDHTHLHAGHEHVHTQGQGSPRGLSWQAALVGLALHSTMDGIALAASVAAEPGDTAWAGIVVFLVIFLHKPFDSLTLGTLMAVAGRSAAGRHLVNGLYALAVPLGVVIFQLGAGAAAGDHQQVVGAALAFAAGTFICIATSDLLPELQFHTHDRFKLSAAFLLGLGLAAIMVIVEQSAHRHGEPAPRAGEHGHHE
ncbi:MAG TPA: ZIP family metal transporter [Pirellulales bacterium]|nr:ZIP family metal transporter [Pirellulales bacterium]